MNRFLLKCLVACLLAILAVADLHAQINTGGIVGVVRDPSGAVLGRADIRVVNTGTGQERVIKTEADGSYTVTNLVAGHYRVEAKHAGFSTQVIEDFELQVAQRASLDFSLHAGETTQVNVQSSASELVTTTTSSVGEVIDTKAVVEMPLNGRQFWQLTALTPGASFEPSVPNITGGSIRAAAVAVTINGHAPAFTGWYLDGANITEPQLGGTIIQPSVDALQEFKVESGNMSAQYGHTPTIINAVLKSGTNAFHGVAYEFFRNSALDAKNYFYIPPPGRTQRTEALHRNQVGGGVGGPIIKDKTFFFVNVEALLLSRENIFNSVVPSDAMRNGDFSALTVKLKDPVSGLLIPNNKITNISPQAAFLLPYMPHANLVTGGTISRAIVTNPQRETLFKGDLKIDQQIGLKDHIAGTYTIANNQEDDPVAYPAIGYFPLQSRGQNLNLNWSHVFSPRFLNVAQVSYYRSYFNFTSSTQGQNIATQAGIKGFDGLTDPSNLGFPNISIANYSTYTGMASGQYPKQNRIRSPQYVDRMTFTTGRHELNFGAELIHNTLMYRNGSNSSGNFSFNCNYTGDNFADFLLGYPCSGIRSYSINLYGSIASFQAYYLQDNFRLSNSLTLNMGLRWEVNPFYWGDKGQWSGFDEANGKLVLPSDFSINAQPVTPTLYPLFADRIELTGSLGLPRSVRKTERDDVAPRFGFAYSPGKHDWAIRGAYGIFFVFPDNNAYNNSVSVVPFLATQSLSNNKVGAGPIRTFGDFFGSTAIVDPTPNPAGNKCSFGFYLTTCSQPSIKPVAINVRQTYVNEYNLSIQKAFGKSVSLDVAYVGNNTIHSPRSLTINDPLAAAGNIQNRRPYPQWGTINYTRSDGSRNYNSLQAKLKTNAWHGVSMLVAYTYSKCLDNGSYNVDTIATNSGLSYYGPCYYDRPQIFVPSFVAQSPFGRGKAFGGSMPKWADAIVGGWRASGIITIRSGAPFTPLVTGDYANSGVSGQRPNRVGPIQMVRKQNCWFYISANTACKAYLPGGQDSFAAPAAYTYGNSGRYILRGDRLMTVDTSLVKVFKVFHEQSMQFRAAAYNTLNQTTFALPSTAVDNTSGATVSATGNPSRQIEFALKYSF